MVLTLSLISTVIVSLISLIGIFTLFINERLLGKILFGLIGFSAGSLIGGAFLHILPEVLEHTQANRTFSYVIAGMVIFFIMEKYFYWRHCHEGKCDVHAFTYLNIIGDGVHNFIDGMLITASFSVSAGLGLVTTTAVILHEIPQELGDFGVLVYGGFSRKKALFFNFISALAAIIGALVSYFIIGAVEGFSNFLLPLTAGGFIYIASSDLIPEIHKEGNFRRSILAFGSFILGLAVMALARVFIPG
ncbi:MAG: ZIP family metal transporter [Candidatus Omnitrophota bacterium]|nr:MAG: ZIP family metal transporter [Candidatus Omnitrophota bacterium]